MRLVWLLVTLTAAFVVVGPSTLGPVHAGSALEQQKTNPRLLPRALDLYSGGQFDAGMLRIVEASGFTIEEAQNWVNAA